MNLFVLFAEFFKIGLFAVGGGLATVPFLFELAEQYPWLSREKVGDLLAVAQSAPGAIGVNMSAQAGFLAAGIAGSFTAALGLVAPSIIIIVIVARVLDVFKENRMVTAVFGGLRPAAAGLLGAAGLGVWKLALYNTEWRKFYQIIRWKEALVFIVIFVCLRKLKRAPAILLYMAAAGAAGILLKL